MVRQSIHCCEDSARSVTLCRYLLALHVHPLFSRSCFGKCCHSEVYHLVGSGCMLELRYNSDSTLSIAEQGGSCQLENCGLVEQVILCRNSSGGGSVSEDCSGCNLALNEENSDVEECCNNIVQLIRNPTRDSGTICTQTFGATVSQLTNIPVPNIRVQILSGTYIMPQIDFIFTCSGCIQSIQLAVTNTSVVKNAQGEEQIHFHIFASKTMENTVFERTQNFTWNSSVVESSVGPQRDHVIVLYKRPLDFAEVCFDQSDVFGFTILNQSESEVVMTSGFFNSQDVIFDVSTHLSTSTCPQLSSIGLYEFDRTSTRETLKPLIHIETGKSFLPVSYTHLTLPTILRV